MRRALAGLAVTLALPAPALAQGGAAKPVVGGGLAALGFAGAVALRRRRAS